MNVDYSETLEMSPEFDLLFLYINFLDEGRVGEWCESQVLWFMAPLCQLRQIHAA